jgi:hypothetical protein
MNDKELSALHRGVKILHDPIRNKGTAFTLADRKALHLEGLLPPRVHSPAEQELRVLGNVRSKPTDLSRYLYMISLQDRNETLFYRVVMNNIEEMMPIIYTPTVGAACPEFQHIYRRPRGFYVSAHDHRSINGPGLITTPRSSSSPTVNEFSVSATWAQMAWVSRSVSSHSTRLARAFTRRTVCR